MVSYLAIAIVIFWILAIAIVCEDAARLDLTSWITALLASAFWPVAAIITLFFWLAKVGKNG